MMTAINQPAYQGTLLLNEPMDKHTSWRIGGIADRFYTPVDLDDLSLFVKSLPENEEIFFLGLGSNLLVRDKGIRGTVISLKGSLSDIENLDQQKIRVGAGVSCAKLARYCHRNNLVGGEFFAGIPGLLGGALAMNAGAFSGETWEIVDTVLMLDKQGNFIQRQANEFDVTYRSVKGYKDQWFVSADLQLKNGDGAEAALRVKELLEKRNNTQPIGLPSCGSVFKNPEGDYAARLIEACDLKGKRIGGASVSEKHANFIINTGNSTAKDMESLIALVQKTVKEKFSVELKTEVRMIGEAADD